MAKDKNRSANECGSWMQLFRQKRTYGRENDYSSYEKSKYRRTAVASVAVVIRPTSEEEDDTHHHPFKFMVSYEIETNQGKNPHQKRHRKTVDRTKDRQTNPYRV